MIQTVVNAGEQTMIFAGMLGIVFLLLFRFKRDSSGFSLEVTNQLKGLAILTIIFGHIGYFLFSDHNFLFPLSTISGIGVDMFLLLSGYGLAVSAIKKNLKPLEFYKRRVGKIFIPLWIVLVVILVLDAVLLKQFYDWPVMIRSFFGLYPSADIYKDLNSPLWYMTPLLFNYLIFPGVFKQRWSLVSALVMAGIGYVVLLLPLPVADGVRHLYELHYLAFPIGVAIAGGSDTFGKYAVKIFKWLKLRKVLELSRYVFLIALAVVFYYSAWATFENILIVQLVSILSALSVLLMFVCFKLRMRLLEIFGEYSYEIYLFHWPLLYRFDFIYRSLPAGMGTALYLVYFLVLAYFLKKLAGGQFLKPKESYVPFANLK